MQKATTKKTKVEKNQEAFCDKSELCEFMKNRGFTKRNHTRVWKIKQLFFLSLCKLNINLHAIMSGTYQKFQHIVNARTVDRQFEEFLKN